MAAQGPGIQAGIAVRARWLRIVITTGGIKPIKQNQNPAPSTTPILEELTATR